LRHSQFAILAFLLHAQSGHSQVTQTSPRLPAISSPWPQVEGWAVPYGAVAGEVSIGADGAVWFCQPTVVSLTRFNPLTEGFTLHNPGFIGPQGVTADATGTLWAALTTGGAAGGKLDEFDPLAGTDIHHALPYAGALPTRVLASSTGTIWVLDSWNGRVSEYAPSTGTWLQSLSVPTAGAYPISFAEDPHTHTIYATCYQNDKLAIFAPGQPPVEVSTPPLRPVSCAWSNGLLYYVLESQPKLLTYNRVTGQQIAYTYGPSSDPAATVLALPDGRVVVGTHNGNGNLHIFHPAAHTFTKYEFPPTLDGNIGSRMALGPSGELWLTKVPSFGPSLLVRLQLP
jgi:streptogramin lyase